MHVSDDLLNEYLDDMLASQDRTAVAAHLAACPACAAQLESLQRLFTSLEALPDQEFHVDLAPAVVAAVRSRQRPIGALRWATVAQLVVSAALVAALAPALAQWASGWQLAGRSLDTGVSIPRAAAWLFSDLPAYWLTLQGVADDAGTLAGQLNTAIPLAQLGLWVVLGVLLWLAANSMVIRSLRRR